MGLDLNQNLCKNTDYAGREGHIYNYFIVIKIKLNYIIYRGYRIELHDLHNG